MLLLPTNQTTLLVSVAHPDQSETFSTIQSMFSQYGTLKKLIFQQIQQNKSFIVEFEKALEAQNAFKALNKQEFDKIGRVLLDFIVPPPNMAPLKPVQRVSEPQTLKELV